MADVGVVVEKFARRRRAFRVKNWELTLGLVIVGLLVVAAILAPVIAPYNPNAINILHALEKPSWSHLMGTDFVGRDLFSRVLYGLRVDLLVVAVITYVGLAIGVTVGTVAGYLGGWFDAVVGRIADTVISFPFIVLVLAVIAIVGPGLKGVAIEMCIRDSSCLRLP